MAREGKSCILLNPPEFSKTWGPEGLPDCVREGGAAIGEAVLSSETAVRF